MDADAVAILGQVLPVAVGGKEDLDGAADTLLLAQFGSAGGSIGADILLNGLQVVTHMDKGAALHDAALFSRAVEIDARGPSQFAPGVESSNGEDAAKKLFVAIHELLCGVNA